MKTLTLIDAYCALLTCRERAIENSRNTRAVVQSSGEKYDNTYDKQVDEDKAKAMQEIRVELKKRNIQIGAFQAADNLDKTVANEHG